MVHLYVIPAKAGMTIMYEYINFNKHCRLVTRALNCKHDKKSFS
jgi:hypothetical protein